MSRAGLQLQGLLGVLSSMLLPASLGGGGLSLARVETSAALMGPLPIPQPFFLLPSALHSSLGPWVSRAWAGVLLRGTQAGRELAGLYSRSLGTLTDAHATSSRHTIPASVVGTEEGSHPLPAAAPRRVRRGCAGLTVRSAASSESVICRG